MFNLSNMRTAFNRAACTAHQADVLQREITDRMMERLPTFRLQPRRILECSVQTGYLTQQLSSYYPNIELSVLSCADQQLLQIANTPYIHKTTGHYATLPFQNNTFDLIISSLALNWTNDLAACFREIKRVLQPNGLFFFTLLGVDTLKELRQSFSTCATFLHRFPDMHNVGDCLLQVGFEQPVMDREALLIRYKKLTTLFEDFKFSGTRNVHQKRPKGLFGKKRWQEAIEKYEHKKEKGVYPVTFEIIYGHGWLSTALENEDEVFINEDEVSIFVDKIGR